MSAAGDLVLTAAVRLLAQPSTPDATLPPSTVPDVDVTPGVWGFVAIAFVAIATVLIIVDMTRRVRRTRYRGEVREQIEAERAEADAAAAGLDDEPRPQLGDDPRGGLDDDGRDVPGRR
jgi:hypothetical protein